jgi:hypothetical protein
MTYFFIIFVFRFDIFISHQNTSISMYSMEYIGIIYSNHEKSQLPEEK